MQLLGNIYSFKQMQLHQRVLNLLEQRPESFKRNKSDLNRVRLSDLMELV